MISDDYRDKYCDTKAHKEYYEQPCWYITWANALFMSDTDMKKTCRKCMYYKENRNGKE